MKKNNSRIVPFIITAAVLALLPSSAQEIKDNLIMGIEKLDDVTIEDAFMALPYSVVPLTLVERAECIIAARANPPIRPHLLIISVGPKHVYHIHETFNIIGKEIGYRVESSINGVLTTTKLVRTKTLWRIREVKRRKI